MLIIIIISQDVDTFRSSALLRALPGVSRANIRLLVRYWPDQLQWDDNFVQKRLAFMQQQLDDAAGN